MATRLLQIVDSKESQLEDEVARLYAATFEGLFRYAMAMVREKELAEDAIQECFLRYFIARQEEQAILNARAWLYRVLRNQLLDFRKRASLKDVSLDAAVHYPDWGQSPEAELRRAEMSKGFLALLTARELECFNLRIEGLRYQEIAAVLRIRSGTVGVMLARALKKIQKAMDRERN
jgi:RNA polymerase sigma-70 factor (ECF subfamily)